MTSAAFSAKSLAAMDDSATTKDSPWLREKLVASWPEIIAVLILTSGYYDYCAAAIGYFRETGHYVNLLHSNYRLIHLTAGESAILALLLVFLYWRGWKPSDFKIRIGWWSSLQGIFLLALWIVGFIGTTFILLTLRRHHLAMGLYAVAGSHPQIHRKVLSWAVIIISNFINAYFEELTVMGYAFNQFAAKRGPLFALLATVVLRLLTHTWKEPLFLMETALAFLLFGIFYWRTRKLWPLLFAHAIFDIILDFLSAAKTTF